MQKSSESAGEHYETVLKYSSLVGCVKPPPRLQPAPERKFTSCLWKPPTKQPTQQTAREITEGLFVIGDTEVPLAERELAPSEGERGRQWVWPDHLSPLGAGSHLK